LRVFDFLAVVLPLLPVRDAVLFPLFVLFDLVAKIIIFLSLKIVGDFCTMLFVRTFQGVFRIYAKYNKLIIS
jgi:hypothetical protein